jgi:hypothetical protein
MVSEGEVPDSLSNEDENSREQSENAENGDRAHAKETIDPEGNKKDRQKQHADVFCEIHWGMMTLPVGDAHTILRASVPFAGKSGSCLLNKPQGGHRQESDTC